MRYLKISEFWAPNWECYKSKMSVVFISNASYGACYKL